MPITKIPHAQLLQMAQEYTSSKETLSSLCKRHNARASSINSRFRRLGIEIRSNVKHTYNDSFFERIDTEEKAYVLGFFYADGCVHISRRGQRSARIALGAKDEKILERIRDLLAPGMSLPRTKSKRLNWDDVVVLCLTSPKIANDLIALGCVPRKSSVLLFPSSDIVPKELLHHFIRGYFDGDGCISTGRTKSHNSLHATIAVEGSDVFTSGLKDLLLTELSITSGLRRRKPTSKSRAVRFSGNRQVETFLHYLYRDSTISLDRKRIKATKFLSDYAVVKLWEPGLNLGAYYRPSKPSCL